MESERERCRERVRETKTKKREQIDRLTAKERDTHTARER
jgi:hypothetical protein